MFPAHCTSIGRKVEYLSTELLPSRRFDDYIRLMGEILDEKVHYVDPVHELTNRDEVLRMLAKYVPRASNDKFKFDLICDGESDVVWRWTICLRIKFRNYEFTINGLVHARVERGRIIYQREYYDPMESIGVIPVAGKFYKQMLLRA
jgi:hypothetical protein